MSGVVWDNYDGKFYQPYNKKEKIGRICDFVSAALQAQNQPVVAQKQPKAQAAAKEIFDEDEKGFEVVEEETVLKKKTKGPTGQAQAARKGY